MSLAVQFSEYGTTEALRVVDRSALGREGVSCRSWPSQMSVLARCA